MQNNKKLRKRDANIVQDDAKIVQTTIKQTFLDNFVRELDDNYISFEGNFLSLPKNCK